MSRVVALVVALEAVALAQPSPDQAVEAKRLFEEGRKLAADGKYAPACDDFTKSYTLDPGVGTELNLADCQEHLAHTALAWHLFDDAAKRETDPDRQKFARGRADALTGKLATAVIHVATPGEPGLVLKVSGQLVPPAAEVKTLVEPGTVDVELDLPGQPPVTDSKPAKAGDTVEFFKPIAVEPHVEAAAPIEHGPEQPPAAHRQHSRVVLAAGLGIGGVALLGTGTAMAFVAKSHYDSVVGAGKPCDAQVRCSTDAAYNKANDAVGLANAATIVGAVGLAAVVAGGIVYFTAPRELVVAPAASGQGGGITLSGTF